MSEAKFTEGEWVMHVWAGGNQVDVVSYCGRKTLHCQKVYYGGALTDEDIANARLIAAAPDMYAMLDFLQENPSELNVISIRNLLANARGKNV